MKQKEINFKYDERSDVLYMNVGEPKSGLFEEVGNGIALKRDVGSGEVIGFIITDYMKRLKDKKFQNIQLPIFEKINLPYYA